MVHQFTGRRVGQKPAPESEDEGSVAGRVAGKVAFITGSTVGMMPNSVDNAAMGPGSAGYGWSNNDGSLLKFPNGPTG